MAKRCRSCCAPTTLTLHTNGCGSNPFGATVVVARHSDGSTITSFTVPSTGAATVTFSLSSNTLVDITATPDGTGASRLVATVGSLTLTAGATNVATITMGPASGYHCLCVCATPVLPTLQLIVTTTAGQASCGFPSDTLTYGAPPAWAGGSAPSNVWWGAANFTLVNHGGYALSPCVGGPDTLIFFENPNVSGSTNLMNTGSGTVTCIPADIKGPGKNPSVHGGVSFNFSNCTFEIKE